jgi:heptosyltransferase II
MPPSPPQRILVRSANWLGDAVMTTPALQRLREARPGAHIILLAPAKLADIWQNHPAINSVMTFAVDENAWSIGRRLRAEKFDLGLVLPNSPRSAFELWLARIPERIGYARVWRSWSLTRAITPRPGGVAMHKRTRAEINRLIQSGAASANAAFPVQAHHIYQYLHLVAALGANPEPLPPKLVVTPEAVAQFAAKFKLAGDSANPAPWFGLNAGAEYGPAKRWPEQRFIDAAIQIQQRTRCRWLIFGLAAEKEMASRIAAGIQQAAGSSSPESLKNPPAVNLAGATSLGELCAALKLCRVLLTNDSGPMHVAAAVGTTVVVPFGSTSPELTGPGLPGDTRHQLLRAHVPCSPCFLRECPIDFRCMTGISVASVVEAVLRAAS